MPTEDLHIEVNVQPTTDNYYYDGPGNAGDFERDLELVVQVASDVSNLNDTEQRVLYVDVDIAMVGLEVDEPMELFEAL